MKVTLASICATGAADSAGRPALTPELLAATGARYSRSDEGLEAIIAKIDPANPDKSVDGIFKMVDYGHASIADMAPVALFMDGMSLLLAYILWSLCPVAGGQESSTRYIRMGAAGLMDADLLGIPEATRAEWAADMQRAFDAYEAAAKHWEDVATANPEVTRIPASLLADETPKAKRMVERMRRNFAFDRARYFLPLAAKTNVMMIQSARAWVTLVQHLLSHPLPEARQLGELVQGELALASPRLLKHAAAKPSFVVGQAAEWKAWSGIECDSAALTHEPTPHIGVWEPFPGAFHQFAGDLAEHDNRYAYLGETLRRTAVRFSWEAVAFAEIRDLNRHRTGTKYCPLLPLGFYFAEEQLRAPHAEYSALGETVGRRLTDAARRKLQGGEPTGIYHALLGTQFRFEHTTTADKFIYEAELRTGTGAHYRYAQHLHDALTLWYDRFPDTRGLILEGSAEPE